MISKNLIRAVVLSTAILVLPPAFAKERSQPAYEVVNEDFGIPVFPHDIKDRPYEVVGEVKAGVRKATIFSKAPSQEKIYKELWERAEKLGAHAVINASYGDPHITALSWGSTTATGTAIRFTGPAIQPQPPAPPAAAPASAPAAPASSSPPTN